MACSQHAACKTTDRAVSDSVSSSRAAHSVYCTTSQAKMQVEPSENVSDAFKKGAAKLQSNAYPTFCFGTLHDPIGLAVGVKLRDVCEDDQ